MAYLGDVSPLQTIKCANNGQYNALKKYLDTHQYGLFGLYAQRIDNAATKTITLLYPTWRLEQ